MKTRYIAAILGAILFFAGCVSNANDTNPDTTGNTDNSSYKANGTFVPLSNVTTIEVIHFHNTNQCYSCITVGEYANETVNTYFSQELSEGKISFAHVNAELSENQEIVAKYNANSPSLCIGVYADNTFYKEENIKVWYKISNKEDYLAYLKGILEKRLAGDLN